MKKVKFDDPAIILTLEAHTIAATQFQLWWVSAQRREECPVAAENSIRLARAYAKVAMQLKRFIRFMRTETRKPNELLYPLNRKLCPGCVHIDGCLNEYEKAYCGACFEEEREKADCQAGEKD